MSSYEIAGLFEVSVQVEDVMERLSSTAGISTWWSSTVDGSATEVGDEFFVSFPDTPMPFGFRVAEVGPSKVSWVVGEFPPPWAGTTISFDVSESEGGGVSILFSHGGFEPGAPIIPIVTPAWMAIVSGLKGILEGSGGEAFFQV